MPRAKCGEPDHVDHAQVPGKETEGRRHAAVAARRGRQGHRPCALRRRLQPAGAADRQGAAQPARACAHQVDRHLGCAGAARGQGGGHPRRFRRDAGRNGGGGRVDDQFPRRHAQHDGAREGALRRPSGGGGRGDHRSGGAGGAGADQGRIRGAAACDRRGRGDAAGRAAAARGPVYAGGEAQAGAPFQRGQAPGVRARGRRGGLQAGRGDRRARVQHQAGASGLYRAAGLPRQLQRGRAGGTVDLDPGTFRVSRPVCQGAADGHIQDSRDADRDRRRLRRQEQYLQRGAGDRAVAQVEPPGENGDDARRGVPRHRPDARCQRQGQDRLHPGRENHRGTGGTQLPGRAPSRARP